MARRDDPGHGVSNSQLSAHRSSQPCAGQAAIETARCGGRRQAQPVAAEVPGETVEQTCARRSGKRTLLVGDH